MIAKQRTSRQLPQFRRPPWKRFGWRAAQSYGPNFATRLWVRWHLMRCWLDGCLHRPLPAPRLPQVKPTTHASPAPRQSVSRHTAPTFSPLRIHFTSHTTRVGAEATSVDSWWLVDCVQDTLAQSVDEPPRLLAIHIQAHTTVYEFADAPLLRATEQRSVVQSLQTKHVRAKWLDVTRLNVRHQPLDRLSNWQNSPTTTTHWLPVLRDNRSIVCWPIQHQHLVFAGAVEAQLTAFVHSLLQRPASEQAEIIVYDPDAYLQTLDDVFRALPHDQHAFAQSRHAQLAQQFAAMQGYGVSDRSTPICVVVSPDEADWPDLQPLLAL